jgi:light-harvesting complex I chlorophyll a/b binding protein 1
MPFLPQPENLDGSMVGDVGFDPLGFSDFVPMAYLREAELKHGRICMLAFTGYLSVDLGMRNPFPWLDGLDVTSASAHDAAVASGAMTQLGIWIGLLEMVSWIGVQEMLGGSGRQPGDFGFDPLRFQEGSEAAKADMALKEITHCRLAMLGFAGIVTQSNCVNDHFPYFPTDFYDQSTAINHF